MDIPGDSRRDFRDRLVLEAWDRGDRRQELLVRPMKDMVANRDIRPAGLGIRLIPGTLQDSGDEVYWGRRAGKNSLDSHPGIRQIPGILQDSAGAVCSGHKAGKSSLDSPPGIHQSPGIRQNSDRPDSSRPDILVPDSR